MPKVSVIIPVYNVENYIDRCLKSVTNQTISDLEIIVVNDGSTDKSKEIINNYLEKFKNIKYYEKENGGLSDARNFGMQYATGEYIAFLDSDDYIELKMYEEMYNIAKKENSDMVECDYIWEYPKKKRNDIGIIYNGKKEAIEKARVVAWNKLIKREIIESKNIKFPFGLRYEDVEFFYKLVPYLNKISFCKKILLHYTQRENSIANTQNTRTKDIFKVLENVINYYKENEFYEEYIEQIEYVYVKFLLCSSLKRMCKIKNKQEREQALEETWNNINNKFPKWKKNKILKKISLKNLYMRSNNRITFKIYCLGLSIGTELFDNLKIGTVRFSKNR